MVQRLVAFNEYARTSHCGQVHRAHDKFQETYWPSLLANIALAVWNMM